MAKIITRARLSIARVLICTVRLLDPSAVFSSDMSLLIDRLQHRVDELEGRA
jgi:hypothetical protein